MTQTIVAADDVFDMRVCQLGEGPLWHPLQERWYWFDIIENKLLAKDTQGDYSWQFDEMVSAAGWVDDHHLLLASETGLYTFDTRSQVATKRLLIELESNNPLTRSNDGRADPWGGFWIGTMGKQAEFGLGSIYRFYQGELRQLVTGMTITNSICFAPNKSCAYYTDTPRQQIMRQPLDSQGWPKSEASVWVDLRKQNLNPDGAVVDRNGNLWNAQWGASQVACYNPAGELIKRVIFPAKQISCPAFGGVNMDVLLATSAAIDADKEDKRAGVTFTLRLETTGLPEYCVELKNDY
jgi:sugar lactone lactonase YvrE|tara:strand:+ start:66 stop:950 length:885 start_codon:yes stop_codon:yes gene_type:complete